MGGASEANPPLMGVPAAGEIALLVSVMSGQSLGVMGPKTGPAAPSERPPAPVHAFLQIVAEDAHPASLQ